MIASLSPEQVSRCLSRLRERLDPSYQEDLLLHLGGVKTLRVYCCHPQAATMVRRQLAWSLATPVDHPDAMLYFWEEPRMDDFHRRVLGLDFDRDPGDDYLLLVKREGEKLVPFAEFTQGNAVRLWSGDQYFCAVRNIEPEELLKEGHLFVKQLYRLLDTPATHLIHGACVGIDGKGVLLCARGAKGKSTLTVSALLRGFEYVADDYLVLEKEGASLCASPLYSIVTLSPEMYNVLYDELAQAHFVGNSARGDKYVLDIAAYVAGVRRHYPVKACLFPEIVTDAEPSVLACTPQERGRAITHMIHSTIGQMNDEGNALSVRKLIGMLNGLDFYRIRLSPDIFRNVACLRDFIQDL
jgi:hypothetical protein